MFIKKENFHIHLMGFLFFLVNLYPSYMFYNLNTFKMSVVFFSLVFLLIYDLLKIKNNSHFKIDYSVAKSIGVLSLFTLLLIPGVIWHGGEWNYYLPNELASNLVALGFTFYLLTRINNVQDIHLFVDWMGVAALYAFIIAAIEKAGLSLFMWTLVEDEGHRTISTYGNANYLSGAMTITLPLIFFLLLNQYQKNDLFKKPSKRTIYYFIVLIAGMITLNMTGTRSGLGATVGAIFLGLGYYFFFYEKILTKKQKILIFGICAVPICLFFIFDLLTGMAFIKRLSLLTSTVTWAPRLSPWLTALKSIADSPLVGHGIGSSYNLFFYYVNPDIRFVSAERSYSHAHSEILELTQEGGIILFVFYVLFWVLLLKNLFQMTKKVEDRSIQILSIGLIFSMIAYFVQGNVDVSPRMMSVKIPYYLLTGIALYLYFRFYKKEQRLFRFNEKKSYYFFMPIYLLGTFSLMFGWCYSMYHYTEYLKNPRKGVTEVKHLESVVDRFTNVYAMEAIARQHYMMKNWETAYAMLLEIDKVIPHFRETDFYKSQALKMLKRFDEAKEAALLYQKRDYYLTHNLQFLMNFAIEENNYEAYKKEVVYLIKKLVVDASVFDHTAFDSDIEVAFIHDERFSLSVEPKDHGQKSIIRIGEPFLKKIFTDLVYCRKNTCTNEQIMGKRMELYNHMVQTQYFHKFYKQKVSPGKGKLLDQDIHQFMALEKNYKKNLSNINRQISMSRMIPEPMKRLKKMRELIEFKEKIVQEYNNRHKPIKMYLNGYFDFDNFYKRLKLAMNYVDSLYLSAINYRF